MAKLTRFQRSQNAHFKLRMKHADTPGRKGDILHKYHDVILNKQKKEKRVVPIKKRRQIFSSILKRNMNKKRRAKQDRYKIDTYVVDGIDNNDYVVHSYAKTLKGARAEARKTESYERSTYDHSLVHIDSAISANKKRYRIKK